MLRFRTWFIGSFVAALAQFGSSHAQDVGSLAGTVISASGDTLVAANVELIGTRTRLGATTYLSGAFRIESIPPGIYEVRFSYVGYRTQRRTDVLISSGRETVIDAVLRTTTFQGETIVVSASRRSENILDAPVSIVKVDREKIQDNAITSSIVGVLNDEKGIHHVQTGIFTESYNARGFGGTNTSGMILVLDGFSGKASGVLSNELPVAKDDFQDIEIVYGPGAALHGPDALNGVVSIRTTDPRERPGTSIAVTGGNRNHVKVRLKSAGVHGRFGYKVATDYQRATDFENVWNYYNADSSQTITDEADFDANSFRISGGLFFYPSETSRFRVLSGWSTYDAISLAGQVRLQYYARGRFRLHADYESPGFRARVTAHRLRTGNSIAIGPRARLILNGMPREDATRLTSFSVINDDLSTDIRHMGTWNGFKYVIGSEYAMRRLPENPVIQGAPEHHPRIGFYGLVDKDLSQRFRVSLSAREDIHKGFSAQFSPRAALIFRPDSNTSLRVGLSRAYDTPGVEERWLSAQVDLETWNRGAGSGFDFGTSDGSPLPPEFQEGFPRLKPSQNVSVEVGYKGIINNSLFLDVSAFRSRASDFVGGAGVINDPARNVFVLDPDGNPRVGESTTSYRNFGKRIIQGAEMSANAYLSDEFVFRGNLSLIDAGELQDAGDESQPFNTPGAIANLGFTARDLVVRGSLLDLSLRYVREYDVVSNGIAGTIPAYAVLDANIRYNVSSRVTYRLTAKNVLNNRHIEWLGGAEIGRLVAGEVEYAF